MTKITKSNPFIELARKIALKSPMRHRHGCVIVYADKQVLSTGFNYVIQKTDSIEYISIHAEISAIKRIKSSQKHLLKKCVLYIVRIGPDSLQNHLKMSMPCHSCTEHIHESGIPKIHFSLTENHIATIHVPTS